MSSEWQDITKTVQSALKTARMYCESEGNTDIDDDTPELSKSMVRDGHIGGYERDLWEEIFKACVIHCYSLNEDEEEEEEE